MVKQFFLWFLLRLVDTTVRACTLLLLVCTLLFGRAHFCPGVHTAVRACTLLSLACTLLSGRAHCCSLHAHCCSWRACSWGAPLLLLGCTAVASRVHAVLLGSTLLLWWQKRQKIILWHWWCTVLTFYLLNNCCTSATVLSNQIRNLYLHVNGARSLIMFYLVPYNFISSIWIPGSIQKSYKSV